ncbi:MAG: DUF4861 domain-containing protein [Prevotella sp.]|nr:DUF4861 domain-containing protein [Prevotella sp.]
MKSSPLHPFCIFLLLLLAMSLSLSAADEQKLTVFVENPYNETFKDYPVTVNLSKYGDVKGAVIRRELNIIPCQLDDIDGDGLNDELFFLADIGQKEKCSFNITLYDSPQKATYPPRVYAEMLLTNKKIKEENKQDLYISHLTVERGVNPYWMLHHHGAAFENELVAYRIYFDHRQTVDIYGKYRQGLELKQTQFYPDSAQKAAGYGDDVLWVGQTLGLGTIRGWSGSQPVMLTDVEHRSQRIVSGGTLRTIIEVRDDNWKPTPVSKPVDMLIRYTLVAGHRDCRVDVSFSRPAHDLSLCTGFINVKNSQEYTDHKGLRGCWGTDWPVSEKDSVGHKRETVGLGICLPKEVINKELAPTDDNYAFTLSLPEGTDHFTYFITFGSDNESFGYHNSKEWFSYLRDWKRNLEQLLKVSVFEGTW